MHMPPCLSLKKGLFVLQVSLPVSLHVLILVALLVDSPTVESLEKLLRLIVILQKENP